MKQVRERDLPVKALVGRTAIVLFGDGSGSERLTHSVAYFEPGHAPGHAHASDEIFLVDRGVGEVWLDDAPHAIRPGTLIHTAGNVEHSVYAKSAEGVRLVAFASPHMVPGSYPDRPPRDADVPAVAFGASRFVQYEQTDPDSGRGAGVTIATERMAVTVRWIAARQSVEVRADGRDLAINVLAGTGVVVHDGVSIPVEAGVAILLTGGDRAVISADSDLRVIEGRSTAHDESE